MFIINDKKTNQILGIGNNIDYLSNGYPRLVEENIAFPDWMVNIFEIEMIPEEVEPNKYCYTKEDGFYPNPNYKEPEDPDQKIKNLEAQITDLQLAIVELYESKL